MKKSNALATLGIGLIAMSAGRRFTRRNSIRNKVVLITGGTRGLGFALAKALAKEGARIAICARDRDELKHAQARLVQMGAESIALECDVSDTEEVENTVAEVVRVFGGVDILINNAGIMQVGAVESFSHEDFERAMDVMYWGMANCTFAAMGRMKEQGGGQIVNITSVGGKVSLPHLLPYNASKFAALGFSEGMTSELRKDRIFVTTIVPGLMRTGSYVNAQFNRGDTKEFSLFSFLANAPLLTLSPDRAAKKIIGAIKDRKPYKVLGWPARVMIGLHDYLPNATTKLFGFIARFLPHSKEEGLESGARIEQRSPEHDYGGKMGAKARERYQELRPS